MRFLILTTVLTITVLITGCATHDSKKPDSTKLVHSYELLVKDIKQQPIEGASVSFSFTIHSDKEPSATKVECVTDVNGICKADIEVKPDPKFSEYWNLYSSNAHYVVSKVGFYSYSGSHGVLLSKNKSEPISKDSITLHMPVDYLSQAFVSSPNDRELREQALKFISLIRLQSLIANADIMLGSTGTSAFKGKKYFQMNINTSNIYNSLKLDKYGIAKRLFDDSIRKILTPLNDNISNPKAFYGYDLIIYGYTKSFADEGASAEKIEYRFLIPQNTVTRYKDKDISGQQLLDASVVLMNDERIDLKLQ